jgi:probable phosphoglycerate mutase
VTRRLVLLRHGRTAWNLVQRAQGHTDVELDEVGHAQAAAAAPVLARLRPSALWASDLARARQTSDYLAELTGLSVKCDERLREFDVGGRQGLTPAEFAERHPREHARWTAAKDLVSVLGAEAAADVSARIVPALRECLTSLGEGETGIVVSHGAALKVGLLGLLGWPVESYLDLSGLHNCAWATVETRGPDDRVRLAGYNERAPLA